MVSPRRNLKERMAKARQEGRDQVKEIIFPLPDLTGPNGNVFVLLGQAERLMKEHGIGEATASHFRREAMAYDYDHCLDTIGRWFTVAIPETTYVPLDVTESLANYNPAKNGCYGCGRKKGHAPKCPDAPESERDEQTQFEQDIQKGIEDGTIPVIDLTEVEGDQA